MWVDGKEINMIETDGEVDPDINDMKLLQLDESNQDKLYKLM